MKQDRSIRNSRHNNLSQSESGHRRGNTIVLVIGILVLLVIIATAYVTRTQAGRYTATAYQQFGQRESVQQHIAEELANEVALALFARPVDPNALPGWTAMAPGTIADSNRPRLAPRQDSVRYSRDPLFPYNYAPYHVVPWTNPPDGVTLLNLGLDPALWPKGLGNLGGGGPAINPLMQAILAGEDNPFGNPGFGGDTRWLRDNEPLRWDTWDAFNGTVGQDGIPDAYSHWRHITNISRPDNAWRIVFDISDVGDSDNNGFGRLITDLNIPVEQWLAAPHSYRNVNSGNSYVPASNDFWAQWNNWFSMAGYELAFTNAGASGINAIPPNLYFLSDLDGDGIRHNFVFGGVAQDLPESEFITGTARNIVSRVLTDTDGDGYTDAFWFLAPSSVNSGIRTIMAVSIIDNSAMVNANVATRQARNDFEWGTTPMKTAGHHPADLALVGNGMQYSDVNLGNGNWNTGTFDNWDHWNTNPAALYDAPATWVRHVREVGLYDFNTAALTSTPNVATRMDYWRHAGSRGLAASGQTRYNPFGLSDELELRMFHGNNFPWIVSRFEWTTERPVTSGYPDTLLRSTTNREEASEYIDQLLNRESVRDLRRRLTLYSATRNDLMPPSIWAFDPLRQPFAGLGGNEDLNVDGVFDVLDTNLFNTGMRKFDLRLGEIAQVMGRFYDNNADSIINEYGYWNIDYTTNINEYNYRFGVALRDHLRQSLMDTQINLPPGDPGTYYGVSANGEEKTNRLAAAYAANITQRRDANWVSPVAEAVPVAPSATNTNPTERFIGLEVQPFIVEAFIGHVYRAQTVPQFDLDGDPYTDFGDYLLLDTPTGTGPDARRSTIVVVQIANPFNVPIDLRDYRISVFGQPLVLNPADPNGPRIRNDVTGAFTEAPYILEPGTEEKPTTAIYYSIDPTLIGIVATDLKWRNFLDLEIGDHTNNSIIATTQTTPWSQDRDLYDTSAPSVQAIELQRLDPNGTAWVVIDRMDHDPDGDPSFGNAVRQMGYPDNRPCPEPIPLNWYDVPPTGAPWEHDTCSTIPDVKLGPAALGYNQWVQWVRATRAWGADVNGDGRYDPNERSPRYVFGDRAVITPGGPLVGDFPAVDGTTRIRGGNRYKFDRNPDADPASVPVVNLPWFTRQYVLPIVATGGSGLTYVTAVDPDVYFTDPTNVDYRFPRKPTFFDMNRLNEPIPPCGNPNSDPNYPLGRSYPDKGWYSQGNSPDTDPSPAAIRLWFPMQMIQKDRDFEQVGELLNVWLYGHEVDVTGVPPALVTYNSTITTFSEFMSQDPASGLDYIDLVGDGVRVNRLRTEPTTIGSDELGALVGVASSAVTDPRHGVPALPAGVRLLDAFVCDGYGIDPVSDLNRDGVIDALDTTLRNNMIFSNAKNFDGTGTPGMININTTSPEAASANPHWNRLVHETGVEAPQPPTCPSSLATLFNYAGQPLVTTGGDPNALLPRTMIPEAILQYREGFNGGYPYGGAVPYATIFEQSGLFNGPNYENRREMFTRSSPNDQTKWVRGERGMASIGEVMMLREIGQAPTSGPGIPGFTSRPTSSSQFDFIYNQYWRYDLNITPDVTNALDTLAKPIWSVYPNTSPLVPYQSSMRISTDRSDLYDPFNSIIGTDLSNTTVVGRPDTTAGDVEEANALFAGASNIITTRSDTFTVYFRIRSFRQNTSVNPPVWDATNPEYIVDDSRYVMLVDRSGVNKPGDKPRILYMEKLPN